MSNALAIILPVLFFIPFVVVYAENPTPYDEFDFNFTDIDIYQNPDNLKQLIIKPTVFFEGKQLLGSVKFEVTIINPDGSESLYYGLINDMKIGTSESTYWKHELPAEGKYDVTLMIKNTSIKYPNHIFAQKSTDYTVKKNGFERLLDPVVSDDIRGNKIFMLRNSESVKNSERVHIAFDLPESHLFKEIGLVNNNYKKTFDVRTKELFLESKFGYADMELYLIKEGNLFPFADAQSELLDYVRFYSINGDICYSKNCESIDHVPPLQSKPVDESVFFEWTLLWWLMIIAPIGIAVFVIKSVRKIRSESNADAEDDARSDTINDDASSEYEIAHRN